MRYLPLLLLTLLCLTLGLMLLNGKSTPPSPMIGKTLPDFTLHALQDNSSVSSQTLKGNYTLLNIFASWCQACLVEHPQFMKLPRAAPSLHLVGIAWRDPADATKRWLTLHGNPYHQVLLDPDGKAIISLGVTGAPESFLISPEGIILFHHQGVLTPDIINQKILPLLPEPL